MCMSENQNPICGAHQSKTSIGAGAFDYDFGALENIDNKLAKTYANLMCGSLPFLHKDERDDRFSQLQCRWDSL